MSISSSFSSFFSSHSRVEEKEEIDGFEKFDQETLKENLKKIEQDDFQRIVNILTRIHPYFMLEDLIQYKLI